MLAENLELSPGEARKVSFSLTVPPDAAPSFDAQHNNQRGYVEATLDRKRAGGYEGRLEVVSFHG